MEDLPAGGFGPHTRGPHPPTRVKRGASAAAQGCFGLFHLAVVRAPEPRCAYLAAARLRPARAIGKAAPAPAGARPAHLRRRVCGGRPPLLLMR